MARPLSPIKRKRILSAATQLIAESGVGVSTASIAKTANLAEGTLFTYFPTKDDLFNELYLDLSRNLAHSLVDEYPKHGTSKDHIAHLMKKLIDWGVDHRMGSSTKKRLKVSGKITSETQRHSAALFQEFRLTVEQGLRKWLEPDLVSYHVDSVLPGLAEIATESILADPKKRARLTKASFEFFWKGVTG